MVHTVGSKNFDEMIGMGHPVLVEFWAPWCTYCRRITAAFDAIGEEYAGKLTVGKINIDDEPALAEKFAIELVPTLIVLVNGEEVGRVIAPGSKAEIESFIGRHLAPAVSADDTLYDALILGGGPAGYTAALYAARAGLKVLVLEKLSAGGQMALTTQIDNYPGFEEGVDGFALGEKMKKGAERFGAVTRLAQVYSAQLEGPEKQLQTSAGIFRGRAVIIASGAVPRRLGTENEDALTGKGVHYCAACDGMAYKGKRVVVIGGGNSAAADALTLARICEKVTVIHRRDTLRATKVYHEPLMRAENVEFCWNSAVSELVAADSLTGVQVRDLVTGESRLLECDGVFISIGRQPATDFIADQLKLDDAGYIPADESCRTALEGVFAAGDVRTKALRQVITAAADGAAAAHSLEEYLAQQG